MCTSKPKIPAPQPVIQRQAYKSPAPRSSLSADDGSARRRRMAGIATSAQGDTSAASTTRSVLGGSDQLGTNLGGGGGSSVVAAPAPAAPSAGPVQAPQTNTGRTRTAANAPANPGLLMMGPLGFMAFAAQQRKVQMSTGLAS